MNRPELRSLPEQPARAAKAQDTNGKETAAMIRFENLRAGYDRVERLHGLSSAAPMGRLTALIGPNGCGKSTLLKCAAGLLKPDGGEILLNGQPYARMPRKELARQVAYMPQARLTPELPVEQLVAHGRYPHLKWGRRLSPDDRDIIRQAMERTDTLKYAGRSVAALSGGERQRVYLAMMLAQQTPVMLLDEPTTYLDPGAQFQLMDMLRALSGENRAVIVVLHDLALALEYADEVLLMQDGRLVRSGAPEAVYQSGDIARVFDIDVARTPEGKYVFSGKK